MWVDTTKSHAHRGAGKSASIYDRCEAYFLGAADKELRALGLDQYIEPPLNEKGGWIGRGFRRTP